MKPKLTHHTLLRHRIPIQSGGSFSIPPPSIIPKVKKWAAQYDIGFPDSLKPVNLATVSNSVLVVKYSPRRTFLRAHVTDYFTWQEHPVTAYKLFQYKERLADPLWIRTACKHEGWKPVVRNTARRRIREGIQQALAEKGWTFGGQRHRAGATPGRGQMEGATERTIQGQIEGHAELRGSIDVVVRDASAVLALGRGKCLTIGREIVRRIEDSVMPEDSSEPRHRHIDV